MLHYQREHDTCSNPYQKGFEKSKTDKGMIPSLERFYREKLIFSFGLHAEILVGVIIYI